VGLPLHGGHIFALLFALTFQLSKATISPYTEGLGFVLLLSCLLRAPVLWRALAPTVSPARALLAGLELGLWLITLFLARSQFIVVGIAVVGALGISLVPRMRRWALAPLQQFLPFLLGVVTSCTLVWQLFARLWLASFLPEPTLGTYLRFDSARITRILSEVPVMAEAEGLVGRVREQMRGLWVAMQMAELGFSYHSLHHASAYLMPVALVLLVTQARRLPVLWRFLRGPRGPSAAFFHLVALGLTASLHTVHKVYGAPWVFGNRHAIPSVLLVGICALYLLRASPRRSPRWGNWILYSAGVVLLSSGLYSGWRELVLQAGMTCEEAAGRPGLTEYRPKLRAWLLRERAELGELTLAVERPESQRLSWLTPGVGFHWLTEVTQVSDLELMVERLGTDYVVLFDDVYHDRVTKSQELHNSFVLAASFQEEGNAEEGEKVRAPKPTRVYAPRCSRFPDAPTCLQSARATETPVESSP
jgi:hypothetical protein